MAYQATITCTKCGENKTVTVASDGHPSLICGECIAEIEAARKQKWIEELEQLPIEERLRRIEEWIYEYNPRYVPPPRF